MFGEHLSLALSEYSNHFIIVHASKSVQKQTILSRFAKAYFCQANQDNLVKKQNANYSKISEHFWSHWTKLFGFINFITSFNLFNRQTTNRKSFCNEWHVFYCGYFYCLLGIKAKPISIDTFICVWILCVCCSINDFRFVYHASFETIQASDNSHNFNIIMIYTRKKTESKEIRAQKNKSKKQQNITMIKKEQNKNSSTNSIHIVMVKMVSEMFDSTFWKWLESITNRMHCSKQINEEKRLNG